MIVATVASGPSCAAMRRAATTFAPPDAPANRPSSRANRRAIAQGSAVVTCSIAPTWSGFQSGGTNPMPIPSMRCEPVGPPASPADSAGSTAITRRSDRCERRTRPTPWMECAVPTVCTNASTVPSDCYQISSPIGR